jgi:hypothetical protein
MFLRRSIADVGFSCEEVGLAVARADDSQQRRILLAMAAACEEMNLKGGSWPMQCRGIVDGPTGEDGLSDGERSMIASMLDCLLEHLREPVASC